MSRPQPLLHRKSSAPWDRLRPVKQDPLETYGLVSKGDTRLLDLKTQELYYHKIVARYMQFCKQNSKNLEDAFSSLSNDSGSAASSDPARNAPVRAERIEDAATDAAFYTSTAARSSDVNVSSDAQPSDELSTILMALRKLREGLLATSSQAPSPVFSQRVHVFNIRVAILALHPPSYQASIRYLLSHLNTAHYPLSASELKEMTSYLILDTALRENDLVQAYEIRRRSRSQHDFVDRDVDDILRAVTTGNWVIFWKIRKRVDGYVRALMHWHIESLRRSVLKVISRSYMKCDVKWIVKSASGGDMSWDELVEREEIGWLRDGDVAIIRKPKLKT